VTDQQLSGVVMMVEQLLTLGICVALILRPRWSRARRARLARPGDGGFADVASSRQPT